MSPLSVDGVQFRVVERARISDAVRLTGLLGGVVSVFLTLISEGLPSPELK
ncbi:hypothetical protein D3C73_1646030 [compost metagenome]